MTITSRIVRALTPAATLLAAAALAVQPASATTWHTQNRGTVSSWHCQATLVTSWASTGSGPTSTMNYKVRGYTKVTRHAYQQGGHISCFHGIQYSTNRGKTWHWRSTYGYPVHTYGVGTFTPWYGDNNIKSRECLLEEYFIGSTLDYDSNLRCTPGW